MSNSFIEPTNLEQYYLTQEMNVDFATTPGIPLTIRVDGIQVYPLEAKLFDASKLDDTLKTIQTCGYDVLPLGEIAQSVMGQEIKSDAVGLSLYLFIKSQFPNLEYIDDCANDESILNIKYPDTDLIRTAIKIFFEPDFSEESANA